MYEVAQIIVVSGDRRGTTLGFLAHSQNSDRITKPAIYDSYEGAEQRVFDLNAELAIKANWPDASDPEVVKLLSNPEFCPIVEVTEVSLDEEGIPEHALAKESSPFWRISQACEVVARKRAGV